ncbi:MAG: CPBP family intramembrane metalloprotease [Chloroflexi bacterium]|nr:CPBP family intramembrane metalloprotease [Chloroflexota bacterium]
MTVEDILLILFIYIIVGVVVLVANYADHQRQTWLRQITIAVLLLLNVLIVTNSALTWVQVNNPDLFANADSIDPDDLPSAAAADAALIFSLVFAGLSAALLFQPVRQVVARLFPRYRGETGAHPLEAHPQPEVLQPPSDESAQGISPELVPRTEGTPLFPQMLNYYTSEALILPRPVTSGQPMPGMTSASPEQRPGRSYQVRGFNPASTVHMVALIMCVYFWGVQVINFILGGGLEGVAEGFEGSITVMDLIINGLPQVLLPILGVGIGLRRNWPQTRQRLGLQMPDLEGAVMAFAATFVLLVFVFFSSIIWQELVSEETLEEQTQASEALADSIGGIGIAFLIAVQAGVGEEIAFRGALQPVFGFWATTALFVLTHMQYTLTPAALIILGVAMVFGWLRQRYNTTVAIMAHFLYDFVLLALSLLAGEYVEESIIRMLML